MGWWLAYVGLLAALVIRVRSPQQPLRLVPPASPADPLRLIGWHHALFAALLVVLAPGEVLLAGGARGGRWFGLALFAAGVWLYRVGGQALGPALSPFVEPAPGAGLVTRGPFRFVRHPMYLGQAMIAVGAPATLGCRWTFVASAVALGTLALRIRVEERALRRCYPEYVAYATRAKRIIPFVI